MSEARKCPVVEVSAWLDGALEAPRARVIESHVLDCPACQARVREEKNLRRAVLVLACPSAETLGQLVDGSLAGQALRTVQSHVTKCAACSDVTEWTKEAKLLLDSGDIDKIVPLPRKRRGRVAAKRKRQAQLISLALPIAAAATLLLAFLIFTREPSAGPEVAATPPPRPAPKLPPVAPAQPPPPRVVDVPRPPAPVVPDQSRPPPVAETPDQPPPPSPVVETPDQPPPPAPPPATNPGEVERPKDPLPAAPRPVTLASIVGDVRIGPSREKAIKAMASASIGPKDVVLAGTGGRFVVGESEVLLGPSSEVRFARLASETVRLDLEKGETYAEVGRDLDLACHGAVARGEAGAKLLLRSAPRGAQLFVCEGTARFTSAAGEVSLRAGEASEVEGETAPTRPHAADLARTSTWLPDARAERTLATALEYPRGLLAVDSLGVARNLLASGSLRERARALYAIEAVRAADERLAHLARDAGKDADAAFDAIVRDAARDPAAAPAATLAILARNRRLIPAPKDAKEKAAAEKELAKVLLPLGRALEKAPELGQDLEALLAVRALERAGAKLKPLRERALAARPADERSEAEAAARVLLAGGRLAEDRTDEILAKKPEDEPTRLHPATVLAADRSAAVCGSPREDERRYLRGLAHLEGRGGRWAADTDALSVLLFLARDAHALAGRSAAPPPASIVIVPRDGKYEVTFSFESPRRPRSVMLGGSWDDWRTEKEPMLRRANGSFVETLVLPRGRYLYKFRLEAGRVWEIDPRNPLSQGDAVGGTNSVLVLE